MFSARTVSFAATALIALLLSSCATDHRYDKLIAARRLAIQAEPPGDYYIGRRFYIEHTQFWGYLRRPGQSWDTAKLVIFNEDRQHAPDRLQEVPDGLGNAHGYDHNQEYRIWGSYSGRRIYDPNSNLFLLEFKLERAELRNPSPGWLFTPKERFNGNQLLRNEPDALP